MKNADMPAFPCLLQLPAGSEESSRYPDGMMPCSGLTKREKFIMHLASGFVADPNVVGSVTDVAIAAIKLADALLNQIEETK